VRCQLIQAVREVSWLVFQAPLQQRDAQGRGIARPDAFRQPARGDGAAVATSDDDHVEVRRVLACLFSRDQHLGAP
jgi:hypothetical protein